MTDGGGRLRVQDHYAHRTDARPRPRLPPLPGPTAIPEGVLEVTERDGGFAERLTNVEAVADRIATDLVRVEALLTRLLAQLEDRPTCEPSHRGSPPELPAA